MAKTNDQESNQEVDFSKRAQWLRAALLGANDGLLSTASLMMGVGALRKDSRTMVLAGIAGTVAGACSMAIGEFVSVSSQHDMAVAEMERKEGRGEAGAVEAEKESLPNPFQAAVASAVAFAVGAVVPLLPAAFIRAYRLRVAVVVAVSSAALLGFGGLGAYLGRAPYVKCCFRVLIGGWVAMAITFAFSKSFDVLGF
ncbi:PREDICTED: vacuolar iron transporter homolog 4-like [Ipomoea nil]|uniref:vacuolar iron transporter homolog 4-like n=1 Tax=Ipomoea nil TaxID=35883 RepID=UPI000901DDCB|nr:PREDICTED: vacuolar iron transporter homolog 4-like [Ipomoea nil]